MRVGKSYRRVLRMLAGYSSEGDGKHLYLGILVQLQSRGGSVPENLSCGPKIEALKLDTRQACSLLRVVARHAPGRARSKINNFAYISCNALKIDS